MPTIQLLEPVIGPAAVDTIRVEIPVSAITTIITITTVVLSVNTGQTIHATHVIQNHQMHTTQLLEPVIGPATADTTTMEDTVHKIPRAVVSVSISQGICVSVVQRNHQMRTILQLDRVIGHVTVDITNQAIHVSAITTTIHVL